MAAPTTATNAIRPLDYECALSASMRSIAYTSETSSARNNVSSLDALEAAQGRLGP